MNIPQIVETFLVSFAISYLLIPFARKLAVKFNYMDHPRSNKVHARATPLLGGAAIFFAFLIPVVTKGYAFTHSYMVAVMAGACILVIIGLVDDKMGMMPNIKLLGQFLAAMIAIKAGIRVEFIQNYYASIIFTYVWIIGITNALNLLDNMNGLSAGITSIAAIFFGIIGFSNGDTEVAVVSFALAGSTLGFLRYNFPKASIFMGDTGSLVIGYMLSIIAIMGNWKVAAWNNSLLIPLLILGYPIFDTTLVSIVRMLEKRSVFQGGKDHSSHRLALIGLRRNGAVLAIYLISALLGTAALIITKVDVVTGMAVGIIAFLAMLVLGVRLAFVDTKQYGHKKINEIK